MDVIIFVPCFSHAVVPSTDYSRIDRPRFLFRRYLRCVKFQMCCGKLLSTEPLHFHISRGEPCFNITTYLPPRVRSWRESLKQSRLFRLHSLFVMQDCSVRLWDRRQAQGCCACLWLGAPALSVCWDNFSQEVIGVGTCREC